jgi:predicted tellurium resistance membrane protein TerC
MELFSVENVLNLGVLIFLQAVLGFDNLLYISIESQRAPAADQARVRKLGISIALVLRVVLLFVIMSLLERFSSPLFSVHWTGIVEGEFTFATIVFLAGGAFLMYTALKEISHLLAIEHLDAHHEEREPKSASQVIAMIVTMNLIFSFDSILSALAITDVFFVLATAIVISGVLMLVLADSVADFIRRNRKYEVLGLFILLIVAIVLLGEGGHESHLHIAGFAIEPISKGTFYFAIVVLVVVDVLQSKYQTKLAGMREHSQTAPPPREDWSDEGVAERP